MALNAASHNPTAEETGSVSGPPPPVQTDITDAIKDTSKNDTLGQTQSGKDQQDNEKGQTVMGDSGKEKIREEVGKETSGGG